MANVVLELLDLDVSMLEFVVKLLDYEVLR